MNIFLNDMGLYKIVNDKQIKLTDDFDFTIDFERLLYYQEYITIYGGKDYLDPKVSADKKFFIQYGNTIDGIMDPVLFEFYHEDFLLFMKFVNFNAAYDDKMDKLFVSSYVAPDEYQQLQKESPPG